ncbi:MAG TPA: hypothetical protein VLG76_02225 [Rhabdochlamydiaceae bacterium]|nr:hypothetical protein [Rhabdochlamydiaceae bacterium]
MNVESKKRSRLSLRQSSAPVFNPEQAQLPSLLWQSKAQEFINVCHQRLLRTPYALDLLQQRGFTFEWIEKFRFGWNPNTIWLVRSEWGIEEAEGKKLWLPQGLVIPLFDSMNGRPTKIKMRRNEWKKGDELPKYVEISGGMRCPAVFSLPSVKSIAVVVEAEFDAMLVHQFASDLCFVVALGGAGKRPDVHCHQLLKSAYRIVFALDVDKARASAFRWWKANYPHLRLWLPPVGKSPGDAWAAGIDLRRWIVDGICESE